jgi:ABC-type branched-subunit amino acid transport system ATPase component
MTAMTRQPARPGPVNADSGVVPDVSKLRCQYGSLRRRGWRGLTVRRGEIVTLLDTNGAGKTTVCGLGTETRKEL